MPKDIIMYPLLRRYLQDIKKERKIKYKTIAKSLDLHVNVIQSWFWGTRFPRASNILPLAKAISTSKEESKAIALQILEIACNE